MKYLKKYSLLILAVSLLGSCKKQLELSPSDVVSEESAFTNVASLERGIVGVYANFNGTYDNDIYANALYTDEATLPTENNTGRGVIAYRWQTDPGNGDVTAAWAGYYFGIDRANRILAAADKLNDLSTADEQQKARIRGEALALRAFGHLQLLINFSENYSGTALSIPYVERSAIQKPARMTFAEVMTKINADLQAAEAAIPASFTTKTRISLPAIYAIRARAALYAKNWDLAISAATAAITATPLDTRSQHATIWTDVTTNGVIWKLRREAGQTRIGDLFYDRSQQKIVYAPSSELISSFDQANDIRYSTTVLSRGTGRPSLGKYVGGDAAEPGRSDVKIFRTAEMYLIRSEAYAEKGMLTEGGNDLNTLRAARITGYTNQTFTAKDALIDAVIMERFKELAFEGQRLGDLRRRGLPITRLAADAVNALGAVTLNPTDKMYWFPIPDAEVRANENIIQNPGYR